MSYYITPDEYERAERNGICYDLLNSRVRALGWNIERAINTPVKRKSTYKNHGSYTQTALENNISLSTYYERVRGGMSKEEASTKPIQCKRQWSMEMRKRIGKGRGRECTGI